MAQQYIISGPDAGLVASSTQWSKRMVGGLELIIYLLEREVLALVGQFDITLEAI